MAATSEGGKKAAKTLKEKYGEDFFVKIGAIGGKKTYGLKGFALMTPEKRREAGRKGGKKSPRK